MSNLHKSKSILLLSPHSDDIALSLGGWLAYIKNEKPTTFDDMQAFTGFIWSQSLPHLQATDGNAAKATKIRSDEDQRFFDRFGIDLVFGMLPDTSILKIDICEPIDLATDQRSILIKDMLKNNLTGKTVFSPLSLGDHIDHRIFTQTAIEIAEQTQLSVFYEDLPYATWYDEDKRNAIIKSKLGPHAVAFDCQLNTENREEKRIGLACYASQLNQEEIDNVMTYRHLSNDFSLERVWVIKPTLTQIKNLESLGFIVATHSF